MSAVLGGSPRALSFSYNGDDDKLLVLRLEGKEQLGTLPEWHVDLVGNVNLVGARDDLLLDDLVGEQVTVTIAHGTERHINAYVTEAQRGERRGRFNAYRVTLRPWLWFATRNRNCRVFQEEGQTVEQIVSAVLEDEAATVVHCATRVFEHCPNNT